MTDKTEKYKDEKVSPFAWVDALCTKSSDPIVEHGEAAYPAFMVNRAMSQYQDCLFVAAELNLYQGMDNRLAYDHYMHGIRSKKRFAKWGKRKDDADVSLVSQHYQINRQRAGEVLSLLTKAQLETIREMEKATEAS